MESIPNLILKTKVSEAHFNQTKLTFLSFNIENQSHVILNNTYNKDHFLADGCYFMYPWVGRIEKDDYLKNLSTLLAKEYPFKESNDFPLHGFLVNLERKVTEINENSIVFEYVENEKVKLLNQSFPKVKEKYILLENKLILDIEFENVSESPQFFNFGYHPYFQFNLKSINKFTLHSDLLNKKWNLHEKFLIPVFDEKNQPRSDNFKMDNFLINDTKFDTLFEIDDFPNENTCENLKLISLINEDSNLEINITTNVDLNIHELNEFILLKFIQIYTPNERDRIAIEPMSGPSNSFNINDFEKYNIKIEGKQKKYSNFAIELKKKF